MVIVDDAAMRHCGTHCIIPDPVMEQQSLMRILRGIVHDEAVIDHRSPVIPMRAVGDEPDAVELLDLLLHSLVDGQDIAVARACIHRSEHLGIVHDMPRIEERDPVLIPFLAVFGAAVHGIVSAADIEHDLHLLLRHRLPSLAYEVHERARLVESDDVLDYRLGLGLIEEPQDRRLYRLHDLPAGCKAGREIGEQEGPEEPCLRQRDHPERRLGDDAKRSLASDEDLIEIRSSRMLGNGKRIDDRPIGQDDLEAHALIVDLPILRACDSDAPVRKGASDRTACKA